MGGGEGRQAEGETLVGGYDVGGCSRWKEGLDVLVLLNRMTSPCLPLSIARPLHRAVLVL